VAEKSAGHLYNLEQRVVGKSLAMGVALSAWAWIASLLTQMIRYGFRDLACAAAAFHGFCSRCPASSRIDESASADCNLRPDPHICLR